MYSDKWISAENQSTEINLKAYREEVYLSVSLKTGFENLNLVKSYYKTNPNDFVFSLWGKKQVGLTSFGHYISSNFGCCDL